LQSGPVGIAQRDFAVEHWSGIPQSSDPADWVHNPNGCLWDPDDRDIALGKGYLDAGASATLHGCINAVPNPVFGISWAPYPNLGFWVNSSSPRLTVTLCYQPQAQCISLHPVLQSDGTYTQDACVVGPIYTSNASELQLLATSSNGTHTGYGVPTAYSMMVVNPTGRRIRNISESVNGGSDMSCLGGLSPTYIQGSDYRIGFASAGGVARVMVGSFTQGTCKRPGPFVDDYPFQVAV
jgi:hypothetical protein